MPIYRISVDDLEALAACGKGIRQFVRIFGDGPVDLLLDDTLAAMVVAAPYECEGHPTAVEVDEFDDACPTFVAGNVRWLLDHEAEFERVG